MKPISKPIVGVLALLCSSVSLAATVSVVPSNANPTPASTFSVTVSGVFGATTTAGATLGLTWNTAVVAVTSVVLATGSPFPTIVAASPFNLVTVLGPLTGAQPSGNFDAFVVNFNAIAPGAANIVLVDDQGDFCWTVAVCSACVPTTYTQANVTVGAVPVPAAAWLLAPAVLAAGRFSRRRKAA